MTALSQKILAEYPARKTKKQKLAFIEMMRSHIPDLRVEEGGFLHNRNLIVGDIEQAEILLAAHYDTCAVLPFPNLIFPKNLPVSLLYALLICIPFFLLMAMVEGLLIWLTDHFLFSYWTAFLVMMSALIGVCMLGRPNRHTVNDNTSGVITLVELLSHPELDGQKVAFVFFDNEENGLLGSAFFRKRHCKELKQKLLINFDCVSDGDHFLFVSNRPDRQKWERTLQEAMGQPEGKTLHFTRSSTTFYPSDQMGFPKSIAVAALKRSRLFGLYMDRIHTDRDTVLDEKNITALTDGMVHFIKLAAKSRK